MMLRLALAAVVGLLIGPASTALAESDPAAGAWRGAYSAALQSVAEGRWADAEATLKQALAAVATAGPADERLRKTLDQLGGVYLETKRWQEARATFERLHEATVKAKAGDSATATAASRLGEALYGARKYAEALPHFEGALKVFEVELGADARATTVVRANLAECYRAAGRLDEASVLLHAVLAAKEKAHGPTHGKLVSTLNDLGLLAVDRKQYAEAAALIERAAAVSVRAFGAEHATTASCESNLGLVYERLRKWDKARAHNRKALSIRQKVLPPGHIQIGKSLNGLANVTWLAGASGYMHAQQLYRQAITIYEGHYGANHRRVLQPLRNYSQLLGAMGETAEKAKIDARVAAIIAGAGK